MRRAEVRLRAALRLIAQVAGNTRRWLPAFSPSRFIDVQRRAHVVEFARGRLDRLAYELCAAYELRSALRAGRIWVPGSRRHADPASYLLPDDRWRDLRAEFARTVEQPLDAPERLRALARRARQLLVNLLRARDAEAEARLQEAISSSRPSATTAGSGR